MSDWKQEALGRVFKRMLKKGRLSKTQVISGKEKGYITSAKATEIEAKNRRNTDEEGYGTFGFEDLNVA